MAGTARSKEKPRRIGALEAEEPRGRHGHIPERLVPGSKASTWLPGR